MMENVIEEINFGRKYIIDTCVCDMLFLNSETCFKFYDMLKNNRLEPLKFAINIQELFNEIGLICSQIDDNMHLLFNRLFEDYPNERVVLNAIYNNIKIITNKRDPRKMASEMDFIYSKAANRFFYVDDFEKLNQKKLDNFCRDCYDTIINSIEFDCYLFNYLLSDNDNLIVYVELFNNPDLFRAINSLIFNSPQIFNDRNIALKIKYLLLCNEKIIKECPENSKIDKLALGSKNRKLIKIIEKSAK